MKMAHNAVSFRRRRSCLAASGILICSLLLFAGCERIKETYGKNKGPGASEAERDIPVFAVNTTTVVKGQIQDYIALSGDIVAGSTVDTYSDVAGKVTQVYTAVGGRVSKGDPIAAVDPSRPGMNFVAGIARAPISGTVVALPAQVGMTISQAVPLARISGGGALEIRLHVAERFISKMAMDLPCEITLDAWPGEIFQGSISELSPTVDPVSRTMEVRVNVNNVGSRLKAGMFAKVQIITEKKENIVKIPASAVISRFGEQYVFTTGPDSADPALTAARKRIIMPGILIDNVLEIEQGLAADEEIVIRGQTLLEEGSRINIIERLAPLSAE